MCKSDLIVDIIYIIMFSVLFIFIFYCCFIIIIFWIFHNLFNKFGKDKYLVYILQISENLRDLRRLPTKLVIHRVCYFNYKSSKIWSIKRLKDVYPGYFSMIKYKMVRTEHGLKRVFIRKWDNYEW